MTRRSTISPNHNKNNVEALVVDKDKIVQAVELFLEGIGEDAGREGLVDTPVRIANMCEELFAGMNKNAGEHLSRTFECSSNGLVVEKDIDFYSLCEHHLLPFYGKVHIGYIPDGKVVGISKLARTVEVYARRAQIQEKLTAEIADDIMRYLSPKGVIIYIEAEHMCMSMRGVKKNGAKTVTVAVRGCFDTDKSLKDEFFNMIR